MSPRKRRPRARHSFTEYFMAAVGVALIVFVAGLIVTADSCEIRPSPEIGVRPEHPRPTPAR